MARRLPPPPPFSDGLHFGQHVLQKQQRTVVDPRCARAEAAVVAEGVVLVLDSLALLLPLHAERGIGQHVVERPWLPIGAQVEAVVSKRVPANDVLRVLALQQHVGFAHRPGFVVVVLPVEHGAQLAIVLQQVLLGHRQHSAGATGRVVDRLDHVTRAQVALRR